jgi:hypothetical protein
MQRSAFIRSLLDDPEDPQLPQYDPAGGWNTARFAGERLAAMTGPGGVADAFGLLGQPSVAEQVRGGDYLGGLLSAAGAIPGVGVLKAMAALPAAAKAGAKMAKRSTELADISKLPRDEAIAIARKEPHLIQAGDQSEGFYVGGPRDINSKRGLTNRRKGFDAYVGADPRGADWYDRYRAGVTNVTGGDPQSVDWMTKLHGMMSAGVDPGSETQFALRETNGQIAGMPVKAARPAQHKALQNSIDAKDPSHIMLGDKTGEYARLIHPDQTHQGATGVNDFRHARNWGYTEASGADQRDALTAAQHRFMDYETALAVDRANKSSLGGKADWTGEQLQAAPWVRQKALAIAEKRKMPYEDAFQEANKTIVDFFPKHTAFATHEAVPGPSTGHFPGLPNAPQAVRDAYSADPRSLWSNAPGGRDAIYSGLGVEGTGVNMRVLPSIDMQGAYKPDGMEMQFNAGQTARPMVAFSTEGPVKTVAPADRAILDTAELTRAYIDAQDAGAWHKPFTDGPAGHSNSYFIPMDRKATGAELEGLIGAGGRAGIGDVVDTGQGVTVTNFMDGPPKFDRDGRKMVEGLLGDALPEGAGAPQRASVDSGYAGLTDEWRKGVGSGAATERLLAQINQNPQMRAAFDNNADIASNALARMERDAEYAAQFGATRDDIQNARKIIGEGGKGWVTRLEKALKSGALLPAIGAAILGPAMMRGGSQGDANAQSGGLL